MSEVARHDIRIVGHGTHRVRALARRPCQRGRPRHLRRATSAHRSRFDLGVAAIFTPGAPVTKITDWVREHLAARV